MNKQESIRQSIRPFNHLPPRVLHLIGGKLAVGTPLNASASEFEAHAEAGIYTGDATSAIGQKPSFPHPHQGHIGKHGHPRAQLLNRLVFQA